MTDLESIDPREIEEAAEFARLLEGHDGSGTAQDLVETAALLRAANSTRLAEPSIEQRLPAIEQRLFGTRGTRRGRVAAGLVASIAVAAAVFLVVGMPDSATHVSHRSEGYAGQADSPTPSAAPEAESASSGARDPLAGLSMRSRSGFSSTDPTLVEEHGALLRDASRSLTRLDEIERAGRYARLSNARRVPGQGPVEAVAVAYRASERRDYAGAIRSLRDAEQIATTTFVDGYLVRTVRRDVALASALRAYQEGEMRAAIAYARAGLEVPDATTPQTTSLAIVLERAYAATGDVRAAEAAHRQARAAFEATPR